jgi:glycerol kinase
VGKYVIGIDQSTQGTKALLLDEQGMLLQRVDLPHRQIVNDLGWVSHNLMQIYDNTIQVVRTLIETSGIDADNIVCVGICNQRETSAAWNRETGEPVDDAIVWQCARAASICERTEICEKAEMIKERTGLILSPYFPAAKIAWLLENRSEARKLAEEGKICHGTIDSWLIYKLTGGRVYKTDYSNASRTQLFNIFELKWDKDICKLFGIQPENLPEVCDSDSCFGETDFEGVLKRPIPIRSVLGDSHASLFSQGCTKRGMVKATYGTGSSVMMNIGEKPVVGNHGVVTSLAWGMQGKVDYVMEGNVNYTGAVISWLKDDVGLIESAQETEKLATQAIKEDELYFIPAFTGLGAPYWDSSARACFLGINRNTGKAEFVRAALESIAYQITDILSCIEQDSGIMVDTLRVDGGPSNNQYLMQFQSDMADVSVEISEVAELSGIGAAYMAGIAAGIYKSDIMNQIKRTHFISSMDSTVRDRKYNGWKKSISLITTKQYNRL